MLEVTESNALVTVQDAGRFGWRGFGVPTSGPMDPFAFQAANLLAGNSPGRAALEVGAGDAEFLATRDCVVAVAGAGYGLSVGAWEYPLWGSYFVRSGWTIRLSRAGFGMWAYLALAGGIEVATVLGSRSTYLRGKFGGFSGRAVRPGDALQGARDNRILMESAAQLLPAEARPNYGEAPTLHVIPGPQRDDLSDESYDGLTSNWYFVGVSSDRMGYRLEGQRLARRPNADTASSMVSEGIAMGCIQVPADGGPIVMMADCATTGGYPTVACVIRADLPLIAQCTPGKDKIRFRSTTVEAAQQRYWEMEQRLLSGIVQSREYDG